VGLIAGGDLAWADYTYHLMIWHLLDCASARTTGSAPRRPTTDRTRFR